MAETYEKYEIGLDIYRAQKIEVCPALKTLSDTTLSLAVDSIRKEERT